MATLSAIQVLHALDGGVSELEQAVALLQATGRDARALPLGAGDRALVALVVAVTGAPVEFTTTCRECGEVNEVAFGEDDLGPHEPRSRWIGPGLGVREPTYADLLDLPDDPDAAISVLGERCSLGPVAVDVAAAGLELVDESLAGPVELVCIGCAGAMVVDIDVERVAIDRLRDVAARADRDVHLLASAYAWDLATIEGLPDDRRERLARMVEVG